MEMDTGSRFPFTSFPDGWFFFELSRNLPAIGFIQRSSRTHPRDIPRRTVVDHRAMPGIDKPVDQRRADKAGAASYQHVHGQIPENHARGAPRLRACVPIEATARGRLLAVNAYGGGTSILVISNVN